MTWLDDITRRLLEPAGINVAPLRLRRRDLPSALVLEEWLAELGDLPAGDVRQLVARLVIGALVHDLDHGAFDLHTIAPTPATDKPGPSDVWLSPRMLGRLLVARRLDTRRVGALLTREAFSCFVIVFRTYGRDEPTIKLQGSRGEVECLEDALALGVEEVERRLAQDGRGLLPVPCYIARNLATEHGRRRGRPLHIIENTTQIWRSIDAAAWRPRGGL